MTANEMARVRGALVIECHAQPHWAVGTLVRVVAGALGDYEACEAFRRLVVPARHDCAPSGLPEILCDTNTKARAKRS